LHLGGPKTLVEQLVGISIRGKAMQTAFLILNKAEIDKASMKFLQDQIERFVTDEVYTLDWQAEKLFCLDAIQIMFTDDGKGSSHIRKGEILNIIQAVEQITEEEIRKLEKLDRRKTVQLADKLYEYFSQAIRSTPWQLHDEGKEIEKVAEEMTKDNSFLRLFMPAIGRVSEMAFRCEADTDALITTLALLRYKAERGRLPENLDQLVSTGYLKKQPIDPFSDQPLVYRRTEDDFILYSFGADFDDDGGAYSKWGRDEEGGDQVFWPIEQNK
jgi:hypothetical protein